MLKLFNRIGECLKHSTAMQNGGAIHFDVGARLRQLREAAGLSQRQLARQAGVTNGTISLIEQNRTSPSVSSLRKVLSGLPMTLQDFFSQELPPVEQIVFRAGELIEIANETQRKAHGAISFRQVGDSVKHGLQMLHEIYQPGADTGRTMLEHEFGGSRAGDRRPLRTHRQRDPLHPGERRYVSVQQPVAAPLPQPVRRTLRDRLGLHAALSLSPFRRFAIKP